MGRCLLLLMALLLVGCGTPAVPNGPPTGATPQQAVMAQPFNPIQRSTLRIVSDQQANEATHFILYRYQDGLTRWLEYRQVTRQGALWQVGNGGGMTIDTPGNVPQALSYSLIPIELTDLPYSLMYGVRQNVMLTRLLFWFNDGTQEVVEVAGEDLLYAFEGKEICGFVALDDAHTILQEGRGGPIEGCAPHPDLDALEQP